MAQDTSLKNMIVGYCRQMGGLVEGPTFGVYEVLLPDEVAARLKIDPHQKFVFSSVDEVAATESQSKGGESALTLLHYGHPLVDSVVEDLRRQVAIGQFFINNARLEKPGLYEVIEKTLQFPNARLFPVKGAPERRRLFHIVRFNFKASLIADEKRELILPVWMHLQGGYAIKGDEIERLAALDLHNRFPHLESAEPHWLANPPPQPVSEEVFRPLLERACKAAQHELGDTLKSLQARLQRFLELDVARLQQYYDDLKKDVQKRLQKADGTRRPALEAKLTAIENEHRSKLEDVAQKYHLRLELELINFAIIAQPKIELQVEIKKRTSATKRLVVWDGLRHIVEPLVCDWCSQPGEVLYLCEQGHLVHADCLAPQCVECKRTFCQKCAANVQACSVCDRPVCVHSMVLCPNCQRVTCHTHTGLCHAANGEPQRLQPSVSAPPLKIEATPASAAPTIPGPVAKDRKSPRKQGAAKARPSPQKTRVKPRPATSADRIEVYTDPARDTISAFVLVKKREIATRVWELTDSGISVSCYCEKGPNCLAHGYIHRPFGPEKIEAQMAHFLYLLRMEYGVPENKIRYFHVRQEQPFDERRLKIPARWKNPEVLAQANKGFDRLR